MPSLKLLLERFYHRDDVPRPLKFVIYFHSCSCFEHSEAELNMGQPDSINNRKVKVAVVSYRIVFKPIEVSTTSASVESTGFWLHAGILVRCLCVE